MKKQDRPAPLPARALDGVMGGVGMPIVPSQVKVILTAAGAYKKLGKA